jgi:hypothetical protein
MRRRLKHAKDRPFRHLYWYSHGFIRPHPERNEPGLLFTEVTEEIAPLVEAVLQGKELSRDAWDALDQLAEKVAGNEECRVNAIGPLGSCLLALCTDEEDPEGISVVNGCRVKTNFGDQCWVAGMLP